MSPTREAARIRGATASATRGARGLGSALAGRWRLRDPVDRMSPSRVVRR